MATKMTTVLCLWRGPKNGSYNAADAKRGTKIATVATKGSLWVVRKVRIEKDGSFGKFAHVELEHIPEA